MTKQVETEREVELKENPTREEAERAASEGWYPSHGGLVWSRYEPDRVDVFDLRKFQVEEEGEKR